MNKYDHAQDASRYMKAHKRYWTTSIKGVLSFNDLCIKLSQAKNYNDIEDIRIYFNLNKREYPLIQVRFFVELYQEKAQEIR